MAAQPLFVKRLLRWYAAHGRTALPWRVARDPYYTLVSEFMLQQTQVDRVVPKFEAFVARFPGFESVARASTAEVLRYWKGLGYNTRAVRLKRACEAVVERYGGAMPQEAQALRELPGIGPYTAAAIRAFAYDIDDLPVDTNIRRIVERFGASLVPPPGKAHDWASALMDLGATVCVARGPRCLLCPLRVACKATPVESVTRPEKPAPVRFRETARYGRGRVVDRLRELAPGQRISLLDLHRELAPSLPGRSIADLRDYVDALERDGLVHRDGERFSLPD